jgi:hypothetical protein
MGNNVELLGLIREDRDQGFQRRSAQGGQGLPGCAHPIWIRGAEIPEGSA